MEILSLFVMGVGLLMALVGVVWFLIAAFLESVFWGVVILIFPVAAWVFLFKYADKALKPMILFFAGLGITLVGDSFAGSNGTVVLDAVIGVLAVTLMVAGARMLATS